MLKTLKVKKTAKFIAAREIVMKAVFMLSSVFSIFALLAICVFLFARGFPAIANIGFFKFIFGTEWAPLANEPSYGILPMIVGSIYVTALSTLIGVTLGLFTAIFLYKFCHKKAIGVIRQLINLLAGIPSVIFGLFGLLIIVPALREISPNYVGDGILAASIILSIMILPTIVSLSLNALNAVPIQNYEGALALGATKEQAVFKVMLPSAKSGVYASIVLSIGRAIGETMAVIMVIGGSPQMPTGLMQSVRTMTANIAMGALELSGTALEALIATGVVLFVFTLLLNIGFSLLKNKGDKKNKRKEKSQKQSKKQIQEIKTNNIILPVSASQRKRQRMKFSSLKISSYICAALALFALAGIIIFILIRGVPHLSINFIFGEYKSKEPTLAPALVGTLYLILIAISIAAPIGIASAIFLTEYAAKSGFVRYIRVAVETLAAIPSIVYGLFGYIVFVVIFGWGYSLLGGGIALAIMVLPTIIRSTEESLLAVPLTYREGSYALGASKVRTIFKVVLPSAAGGIVSSIILAIGRVVSESAVLIITIGMVTNKLPQNIMSPGTSLALDIYYFSQRFPEKAAATAVVLLFIVVGLNLLATLFGKLLTKGKV